MNQHLDMACRPEATRWVCSVTVGDDPGATYHEVTISRDLLAQLRPGAETPDELVRDSFEFMLQREPRESILRSFDLPVIGRYFPEWGPHMRR
jgi:hypothetical protein